MSTSTSYEVPWQYLPIVRVGVLTSRCSLRYFSVRDTSTSDELLICSSSSSSSNSGRSGSSSSVIFGPEFSNFFQDQAEQGWPTAIRRLQEGVHIGNVLSPHVAGLVLVQIACCDGLRIMKNKHDNSRRHALLICLTFMPDTRGYIAAAAAAAVFVSAQRFRMFYQHRQSRLQTGVHMATSCLLTSLPGPKCFRFCTTANNSSSARSRQPRLSFLFRTWYSYCLLQVRTIPVTIS